MLDVCREIGKETLFGKDSQQRKNVLLNVSARCFYIDKRDNAS